MTEETNHPLPQHTEIGDYNFTENLDYLTRILQDKNLEKEERLEAFEDIIDSEVGDTSFVRARNIERQRGIRQLFLKFEGGNPTGTQKDRIAFAQCMDALRRGFDTVALATCGNYGVAVSLAAKLAGLRCIVYIPETYHTRRTKEIETLGASIIRTVGDYENAVLISQQAAAQQEWYDANPGGENTSLQLRAYGEIAYEIYDELRDAPKIVAVPASNGTVVAGIYKGFVSLYRRGKTSRIPLMVAGSSYKKNPIVHSFLAGSKQCMDLSPDRIKETHVNEPLVNWHAYDGQHALDAIWQTGGWAMDVPDKKMTDYAKLLREKEGLQAMPAATAGLIALLSKHAEKPLINDRFVAIITGRKL